MKTKALVLAVVSGAIFAGCHPKNEFRDDEMGRVSQVYRTIRLSSAQKQHPAFHDRLTFVRIESTGDVVMKFKMPNEEIEVRGRRWSPVILPNDLQSTLHLQVVAFSYPEQWVDVEYLAWDNRFRK